MVASDVLQDGRVVIPAGAEIDGQVMNVSTGHLAGHGSMRLSPETVTMPDGTHYRLHADVTSTPGSKTRVGGEGSITPGSQLKRDGIEYGGAVGAGLVTGAIVGGPAGAAAGSLIGAGVITVHLLVNHPQATLEQGTNMMLTLTKPLDLVPAMPSGNLRPLSQPPAVMPLSGSLQTALSSRANGARFKSRCHPCISKRAASS